MVLTKEYRICMPLTVEEVSFFLFVHVSVRRQRFSFSGSSKLIGRGMFAYRSDFRDQWAKLVCSTFVSNLFDAIYNDWSAPQNCLSLCAEGRQRVETGEKSLCYRLAIMRFLFLIMYIVSFCLLLEYLVAVYRARLFSLSDKNHSCLGKQKIIYAK